MINYLTDVFTQIDVNILLQVITARAQIHPFGVISH